MSFDLLQVFHVKRRGRVSQYSKYKIRLGYFNGMSTREGNPVYRTFIFTFFVLLFLMSFFCCFLLLFFVLFCFCFFFVCLFFVFFFFCFTYTRLWDIKCSYFKQIPLTYSWIRLRNQSSGVRSLTAIEMGSPSRVQTLHQPFWNSPLLANDPGKGINPSVLHPKQLWVNRRANWCSQALGWQPV